MEVAMLNNVTGVNQMDLLFPDGTIASVARIPFVQHPWQHAEKDAKLLRRESVPKPKTARTKPPEQTDTTQTIRTPRGYSVGEDAFSTREGTPKRRNRVDQRRNGTLAAQVGNAHMRGKQNVALSVEGVQTVAVSKTVMERDAATQPQKADTIGLTRYLLKDIMPKTSQNELPPIQTKSKPMSLFEVETSLDQEPQNHLPTGSNPQIRRQLWCDTYNSASATESRNASKIFTQIRLPKTPKRSKKRVSPASSTPLRSPSQQATEAKPEAVEKELPRHYALPHNSHLPRIPCHMEKPETPLTQLPAAKQSLPHVYPFEKINTENSDRIRPQPPIPYTLGKSIEEIMVDMNGALNNLFFYPHKKVDAPQLASSMNHHNWHKERLRRQSKMPRYLSPGMDAQEDATEGGTRRAVKKNGLANRARHDYNYFHLHREDYFEPLRAQRIEVSNEAAPRMEAVSHHVPSVGGLLVAERKLPGRELKRAKVRGCKESVHAAEPVPCSSNEKSLALVGSPVKANIL
ncbi:hypothetical protein HDU81_010960 [Chytriomyces hyalinus]|nr:hypothetical protein HDU81_010960 [Chytriomyces hyalinus]